MYDPNNYCTSVINKEIYNKKGNSFPERFVDVISDPNNVFIKRGEDAGKTEGDLVILHNGVKVVKNGYYGSFSDILVLNKGVHEPAEERLFQIVLTDIEDNGTMLELGSYWAFYSIWFNKHIRNAKNYCIEPEQVNLELGIKNCAINNVTADFTKGFIGSGHINVSDFLRDKHIDALDILHSDIQGYELQMLEQITELLLLQKIKYLFISTHSDDIHYKCIALLKSCKYRIIASADFETETFCYDGIIVACHESNLTIGTYNLGNRKFTPLRKTPYY